jgi:chromosome segregation ATPase
MPDLSRLTTNQKIEVLITKLTVMEAKLDHIHKDLEKNKQDIEQLKARMNMGAGGIKAVALFGSIVIGLTVLFMKLIGYK